MAQKRQLPRGQCPPPQARGWHVHVDDKRDLTPLDIKQPRAGTSLAKSSVCPQGNYAFRISNNYRRLSARRRSVDFLFGKSSALCGFSFWKKITQGVQCSVINYYAAPTIPETNHEHDVEFAGSQRGRCATNCLFEAAILMNCFDLFARARDTSFPPPIFFELS